MGAGLKERKAVIDTLESIGPEFCNGVQNLYISIMGPETVPVLNLWKLAEITDDNFTSVVAGKVTVPMGKSSGTYTRLAKLVSFVTTHFTKVKRLTVLLPMKPKTQPPEEISLRVSQLAVAIPCYGFKKTDWALLYQSISCQGRRLYDPC
jgi:hypothetical protein